MQHPDEGTIHSWLDGALGGDEAARVEAHIKECPECASAVAEARGFIAASSRILTALDNAPRGVIPAAVPKKRFDPLVWRVAATLLVVAAGSLVVFRNGGREAQMATASTDTASSALNGVATAKSDGDEIIRTTPEPAPPITMPAKPPQRRAIGSLQANAGPTEKSLSKQAATDVLTATEQTMAAALRGADTTSVRAPASQLNIPARENRAAAGQASGAVAEGISAPSGYASVNAPTPKILLRGNVTGVTGGAATSDAVPLKVIGTPRQIGAKVTLYEVAPGDTVTLTEVLNAQLNAVVTTGIAMVAPQAGRSVAKSGTVAQAQRADSAVANAPDFQPPTPPAEARRRAPSPPAPVTAVQVANGVTTITWPDATTGNVLKLSGRVPEARLREIKIRIERERAAAAAGKNR